MNAKLFAAIITLAGIATPAFGQFWIVRNGPIGSCAVVDREPTDGSIIVAGGQHRFYATRVEAENDAQVVCKLRKA